MGAGDSDRTNEVLLVAWRAGEVTAGQELWRRLAPAVQNQLRNKIPTAEVSDVLHDVFVIAVTSRHEVRSARHYLLGVALNLVRNRFRRAARDRRRDDSLETTSVEEVYPGPEHWVTGKRQRRALLQALRQVPLKLQLALELRYWEGLSDPLVAEVLGLPLGTVKSQIAAGREALAQRLRKLEGSERHLQSTLDSLELWAARTSAAARGAEV